MLDQRDAQARAKDASQIKRDDFNHARESHAGLKQLAHATLNPLRSTDAEKKALKALKDPYRRVRRVNYSYPKGSAYVAESLSDALLWLSCNRSELPPEIEREDGRLNSARREFNESNYGMDVCDIDSVNQSTFERMGQYYVGDMACYLPIDMAEASESHSDYFRLLAKRGERFKAYQKRRQLSLRWRGMEEYDAVEKANEKLREGVARSKDSSNAKPLPDLGRLHELFRVEGSNLVRRTGGRGYKAGDTVASRDVRVDGVKHKTSRVAYALATGEDPADKMVRNGTASHYRKAEGNVLLRPEGVWDAQVNLGSDTVTVGQYQTDEQAKEACRLYLKSLDMGL